MTWEVKHGDCIEAMRGMTEASVDAVVTDPPYEFGFMGKSWDASGISFRPEMWAAALRVLKPGGHLLAFGGSRTFHRIAVAIEDAGFEVRDTLSWLYGQGFPKSLNLGDGRGTALKPAHEPVIVARKPDETNAGLRRIMREVLEVLCGVVSCAETDMSLSELLQVAGFWSTAGLLRNTLAALLRDGSTFTTETESALTIDLKILKSFLCRLMPNTITQAPTKDGGMLSSACSVAVLSESVLAKCEKLAATTAGALAIAPHVATGAGPVENSPTIAWEPIILARKPLGGTVAVNVQAHGTGALNIDACRIGTTRGVPASHSKTASAVGVVGIGARRTANELDPNMGRWPANVVLDEEAAGALDAQTGILKSGSMKAGVNAGRKSTVYSADAGRPLQADIIGSEGGASRFFYIAKASRAERDAGCESLPVCSGGEATDREDGSAGTNSPRAGAGRTGGARNIHPTVKPVALMRWLVRLVTPAGGLVLDPFAGSGTTGVAALAEGFRFVGIEQSAEYVEIARARIGAQAASMQGDLFGRSA